MNDEEKLQYARDNYSIGDEISRKGFGCNIDTVTIKLSSIRKENDPYFYGNIHIFFGSCQIYCGERNVWAVVISRQKVEPKYEIY